MIARSQRERALEAAIRVIAVKGYAATTVSDLTREAGISRTTFYEMFGDKETCFLIAYENRAENFVRRVSAAFEAKQNWPEAMRAALEAMLSALSAEPELARLALIEVGAAGPAAHQRYRAAVKRLTPLFEEGRDFAPDGRKLPANTSRMAIGGVMGLISEQVATGGASQLPELLAEVMLAALSPYLGREAAASLVGELAGK